MRFPIKEPIIMMITTMAKILVILSNLDFFFMADKSPLIQMCCHCIEDLL